MARDWAKYKSENAERIRAVNRETAARNRAANPERYKQRRRESYHRTRAAVRDRRIEKLFGVSPDLYLLVEQEQEGVCAICRQPQNAHNTDKLSVDHNHVTGEFRGLLCAKCNLGLGQFEDDPERLAAAITYLRERKR